MRLDISRSQVVVIWSAFVVFLLFAIAVMFSDGNEMGGGFISAIARTQKILTPAALFLSVFTAMIVLTMTWSSQQHDAPIRWQNGLFRSYAIWAVLALLVAWWLCVTRVADLADYLIVYAFLAISPWILHAVVRWILLPIFRWIRSGFCPKP